MESRTQRSRQRSQKILKLKADFLRTDALEVEEKNGQGQGPRTIFFNTILMQYVRQIFIIFKRESA